MPCAPKGRTAIPESIQSLVPTSLRKSCEYAVYSAWLSIAVAILLDGGLVVALRYVKSKKDPLFGWLDAMAMAQFPSIPFMIASILQTGFVVCGGILVSEQGSTLVQGVQTSGLSDVGAVLIGLASILTAIGLPAVSAFLSDRFVSRTCHFLAPTKAAPQHPAIRMALKIVFPQYELDTAAQPISKAFSALVGRYRRPSCLWSAVTFAPQLVLLLCVLASGSLCAPLYYIAMVLLIGLGVLHAVMQPNKAFLSNVLQAGALILNGVLIGAYATLTSAPFSTSVGQAVQGLAMAQVGLGMLRSGHSVLMMVFKLSLGKSWMAAAPWVSSLQKEHTRDGCGDSADQVLLFGGADEAFNPREVYRAGLVECTPPPPTVGCCGGVFFRCATAQKEENATSPSPVFQYIAPWGAQLGDHMALFRAVEDDIPMVGFLAQEEETETDEGTPSVDDSRIGENEEMAELAPMSSTDSDGSQDQHGEDHDIGAYTFIGHCPLDTFVEGQDHDVISWMIKTRKGTLPQELPYTLLPDDHGDDEGNLSLSKVVAPTSAAPRRRETN